MKKPKKRKPAKKRKAKKRDDMIAKSQDLRVFLKRTIGGNS